MDVIRGATPKRRLWRWRPRASLRLVGSAPPRSSEPGEEFFLIAMIAGFGVFIVAWLVFLGGWSRILR